MCRSPPIPGHAVASAIRFRDVGQRKTAAGSVLDFDACQPSAKFAARFLDLGLRSSQTNRPDANYLEVHGFHRSQSAAFKKDAKRPLPHQAGQRPKLGRACHAAMAALRSANTGTFESGPRAPGQDLTRHGACKSPHGWVHGVSCPGARGPLPRTRSRRQRIRLPQPNSKRNQTALFLNHLKALANQAFLSQPAFRHQISLPTQLGFSTRWMRRSEISPPAPAARSPPPWPSFP
ncbi:hypothetical protein FHY18_000083 [Xanthomonas arboricola]|nr:hypothetical protein [Xanthomonas sp. 3793]